MKTKVYNIFLFALFIILSFTACQDEITEVDDLTDQEIIVSNSSLSNLMSRTTANFGAADDILDGSSCFSVELPVTIIVSDVTILIETEEDLEQLQNLFEDYNSDGNDDFLDFVFPITIIFNDYSELVIENEELLQNYVNQCDDEDEVINCVDFIYPISFSVFNSEFNLIDTVTIQNDEALYLFLEELEDDENALIVSLNYPVSLVYTNGETIDVTNNQELAEAIAIAGEDCNEENEYCFEDDVAVNLVECPWEVFLYSNNDLTNLDGPYTFTFSENGALTIEGITDEPLNTTWELTQTDIGLELNIDSFYYYEAQFGTWLIVECDDDDLKFVHQTVEGTGLFFEQKCEDDFDCSITDISSILQECAWDFNDGSGNFLNNEMIFHEDGVLQITEGDTTVAIGGFWNLSGTDNGIIINFSELTAFQDTLGGDWLIIECDDDRIELIKGNHTLVLEQSCHEEVFNCFDNFELVECINPNGQAEFNLSADTIGLILCPESFMASFHETLIDAQNNTSPISNTESYFSITAEIFLRIESESGNFEIFSIFLNTTECESPFACFQSFDAVIEQCDNGTDGPYDYDLTIAFANCTPSADFVTYHVTQADAETGVNAIANPSVYSTADVSSTVYVRVEISNQYNVFPIQLSIVNCGTGCTEEDVDAFLTSCIWNAVNYNGSDNLMEWNFSFNASNQIVIIYTDTDTIDATWTTSQSNDGVIVTFTNVAGSNIQAITGEWLVVECEEDRLELHRGDDILVLERTCN